MPEFPGVDREGMRSYLEDAGVRYAVCFGSHARDDAGPRSDVDVAIAFPDTLSDRECFRRRNRIDAELQSYADAFVDVSDLEQLPTSVARRALREGVLLVGDRATMAADRERLEAAYEATRTEREAARRSFVEELVEGRR